MIFKRRVERDFVFDMLASPFPINYKPLYRYLPFLHYILEGLKNQQKFKKI